MLVPFNKQLARLRAETFVEEVLCDSLQAKRGCGANFRFGHQQRVMARLLEQLGARRGIDVDVVDIVRDERGRMSSSRIREALERGDLASAKELLGRPFRFEGRVVRGRGLGREPAGRPRTCGWMVASSSRPGVYAAGSAGWQQ